MHIYLTNMCEPVYMTSFCQTNHTKQNFNKFRNRIIRDMIQHLLDSFIFVTDMYNTSGLLTTTQLIPMRYVIIHDNYNFFEFIST